MSHVISKIASSQVIFHFQAEKHARITRVGALINLSAYDGGDVERVEVSKGGDHPRSIKDMLCEAMCVLLKCIHICR